MLGAKEPAPSAEREGKMRYGERKEFFRKAWEDYEPPDDIKAAAEHIVSSYDIGGICDPAYIANIIAMYLGRGDGQGSFTERDGS